MPSTLIEVRREYSEPDEVALIDAVHGAVVTAFQIPPQDKDVRLVLVRDHPTQNWGLRGGHPASELDLGLNINV